jgi:hypothetical protein
MWGMGVLDQEFRRQKVRAMTEVLAELRPIAVAYYRNLRKLGFSRRDALAGGLEVAAVVVGTQFLKIRATSLHQ